MRPNELNRPTDRPALDARLAALRAAAGAQTRPTDNLDSIRSRREEFEVMEAERWDGLS